MLHIEIYGKHKRLKKYRQWVIQLVLFIYERTIMNTFFNFFQFQTTKMFAFKQTLSTIIIFLFKVIMFIIYHPNNNRPESRIKKWIHENNVLLGRLCRLARPTTSWVFQRSSYISECLPLNSVTLTISEFYVLLPFKPLSELYLQFNNLSQRNGNRSIVFRVNVTLRLY